MSNSVIDSKILKNLRFSAIKKIRRIYSFFLTLTNLNKLYKNFVPREEESLPLKEWHKIRVYIFDIGFLLVLSADLYSAYINAQS